MITPFNLPGTFSDLWGNVNARQAARLAAFACTGCFLPRWAASPEVQDQVLPANGYLRHTVSLPVGSFVWGLLLAGQTGFAFNITDVSLKHKFFSDPVPALSVAKATPFPGSVPIGEQPYLFEAAHPVTGSGLFEVEFWNLNPAASRCMITLGVLAPRGCK